MSCAVSHLPQDPEVNQWGSFVSVNTESPLPPYPAAHLRLPQMTDSRNWVFTMKRPRKIFYRDHRKGWKGQCHLWINHKWNSAMCLKIRQCDPGLFLKIFFPPGITDFSPHPRPAVAVCRLWLTSAADQHKGRCGEPRLVIVLSQPMSSWMSWERLMELQALKWLVIPQRQLCRVARILGNFLPVPTQSSSLSHGYV